VALKKTLKALCPEESPALSEPRQEWPEIPENDLGKFEKRACLQIHMIGYDILLKRKLREKGHPAPGLKKSLIQSPQTGSAESFTDCAEQNAHCLPGAG